MFKQAAILTMCASLVFSTGCASNSVQAQSAPQTEQTQVNKDDTVTSNNKQEPTLSDKIIGLFFFIIPNFSLAISCSVLPKTCV